MGLIYKEYPFIGYTYTSFTENVNDSTGSKWMTRSGSSNHEFIAKLRQKITSNSPAHDGNGSTELQKKHLDEIGRLNEEHKAEVTRLTALITKKDLDFQQMRTKLEETQLQKDTASSTARTCQAQYQQLKLDSTEARSAAECELKQLKDQLTELTSRNTAMQSILDDTKDKAAKTKSEMSSVITLLEQRLEEKLQGYNELLLQIQELEMERNELKATLETNDITTQLQETIDQQQQKMCQLEEEIGQMKEMNQLYKTDISMYQLEKENADNNLLQQTQATNQITGLEDELQTVNEKLMVEQKNSEDLKKYLNNKLNEQSKEYKSLIEQAKSECAELKNELALSKSTTLTTKRANKSLPNIPTPTTSSDNLPPNKTNINSPGGERSILSTLWKRDRESLKQAQDALKTSQKQLAFTNSQVLRLKKEVNDIQKRTLKQQQQQQMCDDHSMNDNRNNDGNFTCPIKNTMDYNQRSTQHESRSHFYKGGPVVPLQQHRPLIITTSSSTHRVNAETLNSTNKIYPAHNVPPTADSIKTDSKARQVCCYYSVFNIETNMQFVIVCT